jgi:hypothetical protein
MRIQILPLPSVMVGDDIEEPFALVVDQAEDGIHKELLGEFARQCGAKTFIDLPQTVEIVDRYAETPPQSEAAADALLPPDTIVMRDRNGNPMNMWVTCSCGKPMGRVWSSIDTDPRQERTQIACNGCGNRLTVTVPFRSQA